MTDSSDTPAGWATVSELARLRGVQKSAVSKRVTRLEAIGLLHPKPGPHGTKLISLAEFERAIGEATDAVREANGRAALPAAGPTDPILAREQARRAAYDADLKKLDLEERLGQLLPAEGTRRAAAECAMRLRQVVEQMHVRADEVAAGLARGGSSFAHAVVEAMRSDPVGAKAFFKALGRDHLGELARMATAIDDFRRDESAEDEAVAEEAAA